MEFHNKQKCNHYFNCAEDWDCDCDSEYGCEMCNDEWESEVSVAKTLGFNISDDGNWDYNGGY